LVETSLLESIPVFYNSELSNAIIGSAINVFAMVIVGPIVEEFVFRGFLLSRLTEKYGAKVAVALSSIAFGIMHSDMIGGVVFGVIMSLIAIRTDSLLIPILLHVVNNLFALILSALALILEEAPAEFSLEEFQSYWWIGMIGAFVSIPWLIIFTKRLLSGKLDHLES